MAHECEDHKPLYEKQEVDGYKVPGGAGKANIDFQGCSQKQYVRLCGSKNFGIKEGMHGQVEIAKATQVNGDDGTRSNDDVQSPSICMHTRTQSQIGMAGNVEL